MRLDKYLCDTHVGSRSQVKELIKKGKVSVNGETVIKSDFGINEKDDIVFCHGTKIAYHKFSYYMLNKPSGVVTATKDIHDKTVMDCLPASIRKDLFPVGRLDKDTEGLLLLTNDGDLAHNLLSPRKKVEKTYFVTCLFDVSKQQAQMLMQGVDIKEKELTRPAKVTLCENKKQLYLTITEGKFHQVKRMLLAVGNEVTALKRVSMGTLSLDCALNVGEYRVLTEKEVNELMCETQK